MIIYTSHLLSISIISSEMQVQFYAAPAFRVYTVFAIVAPSAASDAFISRPHIELSLKAGIFIVSMQLII